MCIIILLRISSFLIISIYYPQLLLLDPLHNGHPVVRRRTLKQSRKCFQQVKQILSIVWQGHELQRYYDDHVEYKASGDIMSRNFCKFNDDFIGSVGNVSFKEIKKDFE